MALRFRKKLLLAKKEANYGEKAAHAAGDAILAKNVEIAPLAGDTASRDLELAYYGNSADIPVNSHQTVSFEVELAGSGAKGTALPYGRLLEACGMKEALTVNTKAEYLPITGEEPSLTIGLNIDGQLHTLTGARGSFSIAVSSNGIPAVRFSFTGLWNAPSETAALANPSYAAWKSPQVASNANTPTFSLHGNAELALTSFEFDYAVEVNHRELINADNEVLVVDRSPTLSVTVDAPQVSALNIVNLAKTGSEGAVQLVHGVGAGKVVTIDMPKTQFGQPSYSEDSGAWQIQAPLTVNPNAGNDEIKITAT